MRDLLRQRDEKGSRRSIRREHMRILQKLKGMITRHQESKGAKMLHRA